MRFRRLAVCALVPALILPCAFAHSQNVVRDRMLRVDAYGDRIDEQHREAARAEQRRLDEHRDASHRDDGRREDQRLSEERREEQINAYDASLGRLRQTQSRSATTP